LTQSVASYKPSPKPSREGKPSLDYCNTLVLHWCNDYHKKHF
jgi:hypothetical protein